MTYDTWKATKPSCDPAQHASRRTLFPYSCSGLVRMVQDAADRRFVGGWHDKNRVADAVQQAKHVMREARALGLYPTTAQLEAETRLAA